MVLTEHPKENTRTSGIPRAFRASSRGPSTGGEPRSWGHPQRPCAGPARRKPNKATECLSHLLSGWPKKSSNFIFTTKVVFPKKFIKFMNSGSELFGPARKRSPKVEKLARARTNLREAGIERKPWSILRHEVKPTPF